MSSLPSDVVGVIAAFLPPHTEVQRCLMLVSHTWYQGTVGQDCVAPKSSMTWPFCALNERDPPALRLGLSGSDQDVAALARALPRVKAVELECPLISNKSMTQLANLKLLTSLKLRNCQLVTSAGLKNLAKLRHLTALEVHDCPKITSIPNLADCENLTSLKLKIVKGAKFGFDQNFLDMVNKLNSLHTFEVSMPFASHKAKPLPDECFERFAQLQSLTSVTFTRCLISGEQIQHLSKLKGLTTLNLQDNFGVVREGAMASIASLPNLTSLNISATSSHYALAGLENLTALKRLTMLDLGDGTNVDDSGMLNVSRIEQLTSLDISGKEHITLNGFSSLQMLKNLTFLNVSCCRNQFSAAAIEHIGALQQLTSLDLSHTRSTGDGFVHLQNLKNLTSLDLSEWAADQVPITDESMKHLGSLSQLQRLRLSGRDNISNEGFSHLRGLQQLTSLDLSHGDEETDVNCVLGMIPFDIPDDCFAHLSHLQKLSSLIVTKEGFSQSVLDHIGAISTLTSLKLHGGSFRNNTIQSSFAPLADLRQLTTLTMVGGHNIDEESLQHIGSLNQLTSLCIVHCSAISEDGLAHLANLRNLTSFVLGGHSDSRCVRNLERTMSYIPNAKFGDY